MAEINEVCRLIGKRWAFVLAANLVLLILVLPLSTVFISGDYMEAASNWISLTNGAIELLAEMAAFVIAAILAERMKASQFGPGIGLLALGLFYWMLSDLFWLSGLIYQEICPGPQQLPSGICGSDSKVGMLLLVGEEFSGILQSIFTVLAAVSLRDILQAAKELEIRIDQERTRREVSKIVETEYFEKIRKDAIELRKRRKEEKDG
jgi:cellobiose-specific phosphotransferase system component IIC